MPPKIIIVTPDITEEERRKVIEEITDILTQIAYSQVENGKEIGEQEITYEGLKSDFFLWGGQAMNFKSMLKINLLSDLNYIFKERFFLKKANNYI